MTRKRRVGKVKVRSDFCPSWLGCSTVSTTSAEEGGSGSDSDDENSYEKFVDKLSYTEIGVPWLIGSTPIFIEMATLDVAPLPRGLVGLSTIAFIAGDVLLGTKLYIDLWVKGKKEVECGIFLGWLCNLTDKIFGWL